MATATKIVRLDPWVRRPSFATKARDVVRQVLVPGQTMSTKDIYRAALKVNATMPTVITRPTPAPPVKKVNMKSAYAEAPHPDHPIRSMTCVPLRPYLTCV